MLRPGLAILLLWTLWGLSWLAAALWSKQTEGRPPLASQLPYYLITFLGCLLIMTPAHGYEGPWRFWHPGWWLAWSCALGVLLGLAFTWWARVHLGSLWSGTVTVKADHKIVDSGPYALVRHPIYAGILFAMLATMVAKGTLPGIAGFLLLVLGFWIKARLEERWLAAQLGEAAYADYRRRVPMLIPFGPKGR